MQLSAACSKFEFAEKQALHVANHVSVGYRRLAKEESTTMDAIRFMEHGWQAGLGKSVDATFSHRTGLRSWGLGTSRVRPHGEESQRAKIRTHVATQPADNTAVGNWALAQTKMQAKEATGTKTENSRTQRCREKNSAGEANAYFTTSGPKRSVLNGKKRT